MRRPHGAQVAPLDVEQPLEARDNLSVAFLALGLLKHELFDALGRGERSTTTTTAAASVRRRINFIDDTKPSRTSSAWPDDTGCGIAAAHTG